MKEKLGIKFTGPAMKDGKMEVKAFARYLINLNNLVQAANYAINGPDAPPIELKISSMTGNPDDPKDEPKEEER